MVRPDVARRKVARALGRLEQAEGLVRRPLAAFVDDVQGRDLASFYLLLAVQEVIDLAAHWVADAGWTLPSDASSTFDLLAERGEIDRGLAIGLRGAAGLRNRIAHGYAEIDPARLHTEFVEGAGALRAFLQAVASKAGL